MRVGQGHVTNGMRTGILLVLAVLALEVAGCSKLLKPMEWLPFHHKQKDQPVVNAKLQVVPRGGGQATNLTADDVVQVLRQVGFANEQIVDFGPLLYEALRSSGAAAMVSGRQTEVLFAINDGYVWVQSHSRGSFIYDIEDHKIGILPPMPMEGY